VTDLLGRATKAGRRLVANPRDATAEIRAILNRRRHALSDAQRASWETSGYIVLPRYFSAERMAQARAQLDRLWDERANSEYVIDLFGQPEADGVARNSHRSRFAETDASARSEVYKLNDIYLHEGWARDLSLDPGIAAIISYLLDDAAVICNSLLFERGSTQPLHFDTYYMPGKTTGGMTATWIALEDGHADAGPLVYYPGSHEIPAWRNADGLTTTRSPEEAAAATAYASAEVNARALTPSTFVAHAGDVFIWHEQLYHGGGPIADATRTRRSLVTHYWRANEMVPSEIVRHKRSGGYYWNRPHQPA
jgi:ectoine hydroxylase-related dioxygenase (phytanoyl-CoA dioxygenase family)